MGSSHSAAKYDRWEADFFTKKNAARTKRYAKKQMNRVRRVDDRRAILEGLRLKAELDNPEQPFEPETGSWDDDWTVDDWDWGYPPYYACDKCQDTQGYEVYGMPGNNMVLVVPCRYCTLPQEEW